MLRSRFKIHIDRAAAERPVRSAQRDHSLISVVYIAAEITSILHSSTIAGVSTQLKISRDEMRRCAGIEAASTRQTEIELFAH